MNDSTPKWLDKSFLTFCLSGGKKESDVAISSFDVSSVLPPGNNYSSDLLRVKVIYKKNKTTCNQSLVIKFLTGYNVITKLFDKLFDTEPSFYNKYLPEALNITGNLAVPKSFISPIPEVLVLEDLKEEGYVMADRCKMLDFDHCKHFFVASANFHATSVAVHEKHPEIVESIGVDPVYAADLAKSCADLHKAMMMKGLLCMADKMESTEKYQKYAEMVRKYASSIWEKVVELHKRNDKLNVLQQADPWTPNMMFKYDETGKVTSVRLLDFQATRYSSPLCSLVFFLWTSANHEVREKRLEELYHIYCDTLNAKLQELDCSERLSYEELKGDIKLFNPAILAISAYFLPAMTSPRAIEVEKIIESLREGGENTLDEYYDENYCEKSFIRLLNQLETLGVFDMM
uniref:CHK kinase-like domain-containing protein n=1 Tax=Graphocephala atropunctata TaxID=36148 RepID=A0A1B6MKU7_9HEMI